MTSTADVLTKVLPIIKEFEGLELHAYLDEGGVPTIGYGATGPDITIDTVWPLETAEANLETRVSILIPKVAASVHVPINVNQESALVSFTYNCGIYAEQHSGLLILLNQGNYQAAADRFLAWDTINHVANAGLLKRRQQERVLFLTPI